MTRRQTITVAVFIALVTGAAPVSSQVYSWEDEHGNTVFSDTPPENGTAKPVDPSENANPPIPLPKPHERPRRSATQTSGNASSASPAEDRAQHRRCERIDNRLDTITTRLRRGYREPTGNRLRSERRELQREQFRECD